MIIEPCEPPQTYHTKRGRSAEGEARARQSRTEYERHKRPPRDRKDRYSGDPQDRRIIAWDGEGMKLRGERNPQSYVLFGCSAEPDAPLLITDAHDDLDFVRLADYACDIAAKYPRSFHIGYYFAYDQNMIIKSLPARQKLVLHEKGAVRVRRGDTLYRVKWIPGKRLTITRVRGQAKPVSLTIDDIAAFFASSFVSAYSRMFPDDLDTEEFRRVVEGKNLRAEMMYEDMPRVLSYWQAEIRELERLAERFRTVMYDAGFLIKEWYGPGALANYVRRTYKLAEHEWGGKEANLPAPVHDASKRAYYGGRFEQFQAGRIAGPIYAYDIRSAYPFAFTRLPSLREGGIWQHVDHPTDGVRMGVYRMRFRDPRDLMPWRPQPFPYRAKRDANVMYPPMLEGWYWAPEALTGYVYAEGRARVLEGWEWWPADPAERPWGIFQTMYDRRAMLKRQGNPMEMAFKLGPNSMYGKMAQRVGWDEEKKTPPRAHTLPIAGWITAYCRASILEIVGRMPAESVIAIETDGIFSTCPPDELGIDIGPGLGQWEVKQYDEMIYIQSGVYLARTGDVWHSPKSRGMDASSITPERIGAWLDASPAGCRWEALELPQRERFLGLGAAISRARTRDGDGAVNPFKLGALHCRWETKPRMLALGEKGKRIHLPEKCAACERGETANEGAHTLIVHAPTAQQDYVSAPYQLPWETDYVEPEWRRKDQEINDEITVR
jgi:hypothetical protein